MIPRFTSWVFLTAELQQLEGSNKVQDAHCFHIVILIKTDLHKRHLKGARNIG